MGIVNMTPDSFYDGGAYNDPQKALGRIASLIRDGADIIDIGGESTRPGSLGVSTEEELDRVIPVIEAASVEFDTVISVDTTKAAVAEEALGRGASMVNDISGLSFEPQVAQKVSEKGAAIVLTHTSSRPLDMQERTQYSSLIPDIADFLLNSAQTAMAAGVPRDHIIIDPGIGFGKNHPAEPRNHKKARGILPARVSGLHRNLAKILYRRNPGEPACRAKIDRIRLFSNNINAQGYFYRKSS